MPKQILPDANAFAEFRQRMQKRGFRQLGRGEFATDFQRLELRAPSPREGREAGFIFAANGYQVVVWTTFVESVQAARPQDAGWVLIKQGDRVLYFARPLHRTENFLRNLLLAAAIARVRVLHRPLCPTCGAFMDIVPGKGLKSRFWSCSRPAHAKPEFLSWDYGLSPTVLKYVQEIRDRRKPHTKKLRKIGQKPGMALLKRRGWKVGKPENQI